MECKYLKLASGENLIVQTNDSIESNKNFLNVVEPVLISSVAVPFGGTVVETFVMQPWARMAKKDTIKILTSSIVAAMDLSEKAELQYKEFIVEYNEKLERMDEEESNVPSDEEVLDAFLNTDDSEDEQEEDYEPRTRTRDRILH